MWGLVSRLAGVVAGMLAGAGVTLTYMLLHLGGVRAALGLGGPGLWFGIQPVSAGVFGVAASVLTIVVVSLLGRSPELSETKTIRGL